MKKVIVETKKLKEMLEKVKGTVSKEENRPIFTSILIEGLKNNKLTMTSCDGYRISTASCEALTQDDFKAIIPIFSIPKGFDETTEIIIEEDFITFNFGNVKYSYKRISGEFIDWRAHFNRENVFSIRFNSKLLKETLRSTDGIIELYFKGDRDGVIIEEIENKENLKLVLPFSKGNRKE